MPLYSWFDSLRKDGTLWGFIPIPGWPDSWKGWDPLDSDGKEVFEGRQAITVGWLDDTIIGMGRSHRLYGFDQRIMFDWDDFILGNLISGVKGLLKKIPKMNKLLSGRTGSPWTKYSLDLMLNGAVTGFDGDTNFVFAERYDYQYFGTRYHFSRGGNSPEFTVAKVKTGKIPAYLLVASYLAASIAALIMARLSFKDGAPTGTGSTMNTYVQMIVCDTVMLGLLKFTDHTSVLIDGLKSETEMFQNLARYMKGEVSMYAVEAAKIPGYAIGLAGLHFRVANGQIDKVEKIAKLMAHRTLAASLSAGQAAKDLTNLNVKN